MRAQLEWDLGHVAHFNPDSMAAASSTVLSAGVVSWLEPSGRLSLTLLWKLLFSLPVDFHLLMVLVFSSCAGVCVPVHIIRHIVQVGA